VKILVDENMPFGREAFETLGEVRTMPGRAMGPADTADAELLLVRSITKVNRGLLEGSRVRFVGTATIGEDHVDKAYLAERGIGFSSAPGCNANSVAEYLASALAVLSKWREFRFANKTLGIIGHGNVGKKVEQKALALGMTCLLNDPPLARATGDPKYLPLDEVLEQSDIVTVHVPLEKGGEDPTWHLLDEALFARMKTGTVVFNTSRGAVADNHALRVALEEGRVGASVLDVWEGEPEVSMELLANVALATPHVAGYSYDGKVNGTRQVYEAACAFLGITPSWDPESLLPAPECPEVTLDGSGDPQEQLRRAILAVFDIRRDDEAFRKMISLPEKERPAWFDQLRKEYPRRREFHHTRARVTPANEGLERQLRGLGFIV
jgi:erythronate-4-phosphate dehydrogenase